MVKPRRASIRDKRKPSPVHTDQHKPGHRFSEVSGAADGGRQGSEKPDVAKNNYKMALRSYRFQRSRTPGIIEVLNENSYVMAEYSERTGSVKWQRMVLAAQREQIEKWLEVHYPSA